MLHKIITIDQLFQYYKPNEVQGYCRTCPNYDRNWSCPPHGHEVISPLRSYQSAMIIGIKTKAFKETKQAIANALNEIEESMESYVLIAGNCDYCEPCSKLENMPCKAPDRMKYSLEALGFHVSDLCEKELGEKLEWNSAQPEYLAVASVLFTSKTQDKMAYNHIMNLLKKWGLDYGKTSTEHQ